MDNSFEKLKLLMDTNKHSLVLKEFYDELSTMPIDHDVSDHFHPSVSINQFWWAKSRVLINTYPLLRIIINKIN